ncbi:MAG TPA: GatB/YqeY domain-containing protein [Candidatus Acidoferrales bacterium]
MGLVDRIQQDLTSAMKTKDELRLSVLRMMKTALKNKQVEKMAALEDTEAAQVLSTLIKQRRDSIEQFTRGGRADLAEKEQKEIAIIEPYLPARASDAEVDAAIAAAMAETGARSPKEMGAVMKNVMARLKGQSVDGKAVSERVKAKLSQ